MIKQIASSLATLALGLALGVGSAHAANVCYGAASEAPDNVGYNYDTEQDNWYHYEQGLRMVDAGEWEQAMREFNYYIRQPKMHRGAWGAAYFGLGLMHQKRGNYDAAIDCFNMAISRDRHPRVSVADRAYQSIGAIQYKKKDYPKAIESYKKAIEKNPDNGLAHYYLGMSYLKSGDLENAEKESQEAKKRGVSFTALDEDLAAAKNPSAAKPSGETKTTSKKRKATK